MALRRFAGVGVALVLACQATPTDEDAFGSGAESASTGPAGTDSTGGSSTTGDTTPAEESETGGGVVLDVGAGTGGEQECPCGSTLGFSYIWIANSQQGTVSKINTETLIEEGRYRTRDDAQGDPSRTSVNLTGTAVAVANRNGGVVKVWAQAEACDPGVNGVPGLQTSSGKDDVLGWGGDDCIAWHTDFDYTTQRPIAWTAGQLDREACEHVGEELWTSGCSLGTHEWIQVHRLDGDTGSVEDSVEVDGFACDMFGGYGGAVDLDGNFWISSTAKGQTSLLARVDGETLETAVWVTPIAGYGMTVDHAGRPWIAASNGSGDASAARFDPQTETWALADNEVAIGQSGLQEDAVGRMWLNYAAWNEYCVWPDPNCVGTGVAYVDAETMIVSEPFPLGVHGKGIAIDLGGMVWAVTVNQVAARFDPDSQSVDLYEGLETAYTYSDMTGWALQNAACAPEG